MSDSVWKPAPKSSSFGSAKAFIGAIRKQVRPKFAHLYATIIKSKPGKEQIVGMMDALKNTPAGNVTFVDAIVDANLVERFGGIGRNKKMKPKMKKHPDAIDFQLGEQIDGAANELRGAVSQNDSLWKPPPTLLLNKHWRISDTRIFDLIELAIKNEGPLATSANKKLKTISTSHGRVASFVVDYFAALIIAYYKQYPNGHE